MRNQILIAVLAIGMVATAQTNTVINTTYTTIGTAGSQTFINGSKLEVKTDFTNIKNNQYTNITSIATTFDQAGTKTVISKNGIDTKGNVTAAKVYTNGYDVGNEITNLKDAVSLKANATDVVNLTNKVNKNASDILDLDAKVNANYLQTAQDIETAKGKAIQASKTYTDQKTDALKNDLTLYTDNSVKESESRLNKRIDALELKIDNRFTTILRSIDNQFEAVNNRIEGLGASMVAMSAAATSQVYNANKPTNLNIGTGVYGKATAIAVGMSHYFNAHTKVSVNWSQGTNTKNAVGIGCGIAF